MSIYYGDTLVTGIEGTPNAIPVASDIPKSSVCILTDEQNHITRCDGGNSMPADLTGWIKIAAASMINWLNAGVACVTQAANKLIFYCKAAPTAALSGYSAIMEVVS